MPCRPRVPCWEIAESFLSHRHYIFNLRANAVKCLVQRNERGERKPRGKRVALVKPDDLRALIERKGELGGFRIVADMISGLSDYMDSKDFRTAMDMLR